VNRNDKVCGDRLATGPRPSPCYDVWSCAYPEAFLSGGVGHDVFIGRRYHELLLGGGAAPMSCGVSGGRIGWSAGGGRICWSAARGDDACVQGEDFIPVSR